MQLSERLSPSRRSDTRPHGAWDFEIDLLTIAGTVTVLGLSVLAHTSGRPFHAAAWLTAALVLYLIHRRWTVVTVAVLLALAITETNNHD